MKRVYVVRTTVKHYRDDFVLADSERDAANLIEMLEKAGEVSEFIDSGEWTKCDESLPTVESVTRVSSSADVMALPIADGDERYVRDWMRSIMWGDNPLDLSAHDCFPDRDKSD